jgi:type IV pilus assembly protein PilA
MRAALAAGVLIAMVSGCKKEAAAPRSEAPKPPASTAELDALWALAPKEASFGFVASPHGLAMLERGAIAIDALLEVAPDLAPLRGKLDEALRRDVGVSKLRLAEFGLTADKGFAAFSTGTDQGVVIIPVADRDKFLAKVKGTKGTDHDVIKSYTCKTIDGRYTCAASPELFAKLGGAGLQAPFKTAGVRGDLELAGHGITDPEDPTVAMAIQVAPGSFVLRGTVSRLPAMVTDMIGSPSRPRDGLAVMSGFGWIDVAPYLARLPPVPIAENVTLADLGKTIAGPIAFGMPSNTLDFDIRIPLSDPGPAKALVEHCTDLPPLAAVGATIKDGACRVPIPQTAFVIDAWIDGKELRIGNRAATPTKPLAPSPLAQELAGGEWSVAFFGRGTGLDLSAVPGSSDLLQSTPAESKMFLRAITLFNEAGLALRKDGDALRFVLGVRTVWSNPDSVVQGVLKVSPEQTLSKEARATVASIAAAAPSSPFAEDAKAGVGGMALITAPVGILAAVAIPAYMDYMKRSKKTEAALQLNKISRNAKRAYVESSAFPTGDAPLTPSEPCCGGPSNHCAMAPGAWQQPVWKALDFQIDVPSLFRYSYRSDGKTFTATAVGDLDCDGTEITYELRGTVENGTPVTSLVEPALNAD